MLQKENEEYANLTGKIPDYQKELFQVQSTNFELKCLVANLQSQLESCRNQSQELLQQPIVRMDSNFDSKPNPDVVTKYEDELKATKSQVAAAHDEIFKLNESLVKADLELQSKIGTIKKLEESKESGNYCNLELTLDNQKLNQTILELQDKLASCQRSKSNLEQNVSLMRNERESLVKSRDYFQSTCAQAQEARNVIQKDLIAIQSEIAAKSMQTEKLKIEALQVKKVLDEEREKSLQEKEEMKRQLEDLELSLINSPASEMNSLVLSEDSGHDPDEDLEMQIELLKEDIREKAFKIQELEEKLNRAEQLSTCLKQDNDRIHGQFNVKCKEVEEVQRGKIIILEDLKIKDNLIQELEGARVEMDAKYSQRENELRNLNISWQQVKAENQTLRDNLKKCQDQATQKDTLNEKLEMSLKLCGTEMTNMKKVLETMKDVHDENILLKKQCLSQDHQVTALKEAFEASDEARQALEQAHSELLEENQRLISTAPSLCNKAEEALKEALETKANALDQATNQINALQKINTELQAANECLLTKPTDTESSDYEKADLELRNSRLECSLNIYHDEISRLTTKIVDLEETVIAFEHKNGKLLSEQSQNSQLKSQIQKLQDDIAKDTALRQELLSSIEMAKKSLLSEVQALEQRLHKEKEGHAATKNKMVLLEHECSELRVDRRSLRTGLETADLTIEKLKRQMKNETARQNNENEDGSCGRRHAGSIQDHHHFQQAYEDGKRVILTLEDQVNQLKFQLEKKISELEALQDILKAKEETFATERNELKSTSDHFRAELVSMALKMDKLSEEKKNSLEHIKRLRTTQLVQADLEDLAAGETNLENKIQTNPDLQRHNLTNLQNCLKSLKYEMAVLHKRLAPSTPNSPSKCAKDGQ